MPNENVLLRHRMQLRYLPTAATLLAGFVPYQYSKMATLRQSYSPTVDKTWKKEYISGNNGVQMI